MAFAPKFFLIFDISLFKVAAGLVHPALLLYAEGAAAFMAETSGAFEIIIAQNYGKIYGLPCFCGRNQISGIRCLDT